MTAGTATDGSGESLEQQGAQADGYTVTVVDDATWQSMTAADFRAYRVIIIGDPSCGDTVSPSSVAYSNASTWESVVMSSGGNKVLIGTDPTFHNNGPTGTQRGDLLEQNGIAYAGAVPGATGLYLDLSCSYDSTSPGTPVPILDGLSTHGPGSFTAVGEGYYGACATAVNVIANTGPTTGLSDANLSDWGCSVHEAFDKFPVDYAPLALAPNSSGFPVSYCGTDVETASSACGSPYILVSGSGIVSGGPSTAEAGGAPPLSEHSTICSTSRPVNCATGTFWHTFTDSMVPGNGPALDLTRTYSSDQAALDGPFGFGWTDSYNMSLSVDSSTGNATVTDADGSQVPFVNTGSSALLAPARVLASLVRNSDGTYTFTRFSDHIQNVFNSSGQLIQQIDRNGYKTTMSYNAGQLASVTDPAGRELSFAYTGSHVSSVTDPAGNTTVYAYDSAGNLSSVTDPMGRTTTFTYDPAHLMLSMTDPRGGITTNTYNASGQVVRQVDPSGNATAWSYTGDPSSTSGSTTTITDPNGNVTVEKYQNMQLLSITRGAGTPQAATTSFEYDPNTLGITETTDPNGNITRATYDDHGNVLSRTNALGNTTTYSYNSFDEPTSMTDPLGTVTTYDYDSNGNLLAQSTPLTTSSSGPTSTTTFTYGTGVTAGDVLSSTDPDGNTTTYGYNGAGDRTSVTDALGLKTAWSYDTDGHPLSSTTPAGRTTSYSYDADGELTKVTNPLGDSTSYTYDANGNQASVTDANGNTTRYAYSADDQQTKTIQPNGNTQTTGYDAAGNTTSQTNGNGQTTTYTYDPLDRVVTTTDPDGHKTTNTYDGAGNLLTTVDASGQTTTYTYDADNQVTAISYSDGTTPSVTESYDADGRRTGLTDGTGASSFTYDALGLLTSQTNGSGATSSYGYDPAGNVTSITYPNGKTATRAYNADGQLQSVTDWLGNTTTFTHNLDGNLASESLPGGVSSTLAYDSAGNLTGITDNQAGTAIADFSYARDNIGQVTGGSVTGAITDSTTYRYDTNNRLTGFNTSTYQYDAANNPTGFVNGQSQTFDPAGELLTSTAATTASGSGSGSGGGSGLGGGSAPGTANPAVPNTGAGSTSASGSGVAPSQVLRGPKRVSSTAVWTTRTVGSTGSLAVTVATHLRGQTLLAFLSTSRSGRGDARLAPSSRGLRWKSVRVARTGSGTVEIWEASAVKPLRRLQVKLNGLKELGATLFSVVAITPGARLARAFARTGKRSAPKVGVTAPAGALVLAVGQSNATGRIHPLTANRLISQDHSSRPRAIAWLQRYISKDHGARRIGERAPKAANWLLAAVLLDPEQFSPHRRARAMARMAAETVASGERTYGYNADGDRTSISSSSGVTTLGYDQANRLINISGGISYSYDGDGLRMSKTVGGASTQFAWDESGGLPLLLQSGSTYYIYGPGGQPIEQITNGTPTYLLSDQQGSTRLLTDGSGNVVGTYSYDAWGNVTSHTGSAMTDLQYDGQYTDSETGYQYLLARYYDPSTGLFLAVDPYVSTTGTAYGYAQDDPVDNSDPSGASVLTDLVSTAGDQAFHAVVSSSKWLSKFKPLGFLNPISDIATGVSAAKTVYHCEAWGVDTLIGANGHTQRLKCGGSAASTAKDGLGLIPIVGPGISAFLDEITSEGHAGSNTGWYDANPCDPLYGHVLYP